MDFLDFAYFVLHPENNDMPPDRRQLLVREFQATTLWDWGLSTPRGPGDDLESVRVVDSASSGALLEILIRPNQSTSWLQIATFYFSKIPCLLPLLFVFLAVAVTLFVTGIVRLGRMEPSRRRR